MNLTLDSVPFPNLMGFLALIVYLVTLLPTLLKINFPATQKTGIHGYPYINQRDFDLLDLETPWVYIQGVVSFLILVLMAITSNDWSMKRLKKKWKKLHQLTYLVIFVLIWHIWDKMSGHWTYVTPIGLIVSMGIAILLMMRVQIEHQNEQQRIQKKEASAMLISSSEEQS
jgi:methionine sulfoxide reductase heme-binding subunit